MSKSVSVIYKNSQTESNIVNIFYIIFSFSGALGTIMSFASCFQFEKSFLFYLVPMMVTVLACTFFLWERFYKKALFFLMGGTGIFVLCRLEDITGSFITVANIVINDVNESYQMGFSKIDYPEYAAHYKEADLFLLLGIFVITVIISFFVMGYASVLGCILISLPFTIFGIFFDLFPELIYLVLSVTFWTSSVVLHASGRRGRRRSDTAVYNALFLTGMIFAIFFISQSIMPEEKYQKSQKLYDVKDILNQYAADIASINIGIDGGPDNKTGIGNGEFGEQDRITFTGQTMLTVRVPFLNRNIYLKGFEYNEYTGNSWKNNSGWADWYQSYVDSSGVMDVREYPINFTGSILDGSKKILYIYGITPSQYNEMVKEYQVTIQNVREENYAFAPYGAVFRKAGRVTTDVMPGAEGKKYTYDVYTADAGEFHSNIPISYFLSYWNNVLEQNRTDNLGLSEAAFYKLASVEKEYAAFARKAYTQVPSELADVLKQYAPQAVEYDYEPTMEFVQSIQQMFLQDFTYTLEPGKVPDGEDGVVYFLQDSRKGYCVYFASAATLIFRMAGIPARYVEGYVITPEMAKINRKENETITRKIGNESFQEDIAYVTVTVPDNKAHAWTEIYIAGYGWIPIEVTPGYYTERDIEAEKEERTTEEETTAKETESESEHETTKEMEEDKTIEKTEFQWNELVKMLLFLAGVMFFAVSGIYIGRCWYKKGEKKILSIIDGKEGMLPDERACLAWWYIESVLKYMNKPMPDNISCEEQKRFLKENIEFFSCRDLDDKIDNIIKAYYGNESLTNEEITKIGEMIGQFRREIYKSLSISKRFSFKYLKRL